MIILRYKNLANMNATINTGHKATYCCLNLCEVDRIHDQTWRLQLPLRSCHRWMDSSLLCWLKADALVN